MKLKLLPRALPVLLLALALSLPVFYGCPNNNPHPALGDTLALWTFEGTLADVSGNGHNGTPIGHVHYASDRSKTMGRALVLDSAASVLVQNVGNLAFTGQSSYSITAWIRTRSLADQAIYNWGPAKAGSPGLLLGLSNGRAYAAITASPSTIEVKGNSVIADNNWHLLTLSVDAPNKVMLYVDTTLVAQSSTGSLKPQDQNKGNLRIGRAADSTEVFYGSIAKLGVYRYPMTITHITAEFTDDVAPGPPITGVTAPTDNLSFACDNQGRIAVSTDNISWPFTSVTPSPLHTITALDAVHVIAAGDDGTVLATNDGGATWVPVSVPAFLATQTVFAARFLGPKLIALGGGREDQLSRFLIVGTATGAWPNFSWSTVFFDDSARAVSSIAANDTVAMAAGWDSRVYSCNNIGSDPTIWLSVNSPANLHFTCVDLRPQSGDGSLVTDDGFHFPVEHLTINPSDWSTPGNALWTTLSTPTDLWIGGAIGNASNQNNLYGAILKHNNVDAPTDAPYQVWYSGARSPSNLARVGGLEGYMHNGAPGTVVFVQ